MEQRLLGGFARSANTIEDMYSLFRRSFLAAAFLLLGVSLLGAQDWKTTQSLPGVDLDGLSSAQKTSVLKLLREQSCSCGCNMMVAECRVKDPTCSYSKGLTAAIIDAIKSGKTEKEALAAAASSHWAHVEAPKLLDDAIKIPTEGSPSLGPANAPITLVEFSDFECPYCALAVPQIKALMKAYPTQVRLIYKEYPLETHPHADLAAAAALAGHKQGKFWQMHDAMYAHRDNLSRKTIMELAKENGLDTEKFENDMDSTDVRESVVRDVQDGETAGVEGTPTLFVNGQHYNGSIDFAALKPVLEAELKHTPANQTASATH